MTTGRILRGDEKARSIARFVQWFATRDLEAEAVFGNAPIVEWVRKYGSRNQKPRRGGQRTKEKRP